MNYTQLNNRLTTALEDLDAAFDLRKTLVTVAAIAEQDAHIQILTSTVEHLSECMAKKLDAIGFEEVLDMFNNGVISKVEFVRQIASFEPALFKE